MATSLTVRQVAERVGRTEETVRRWIWAGRLPATKRGNVLFVDEDDLPATAIRPRGSHERASGESSQQSLTFMDWGRQVEAWRATTGPSTGSAADLVIEDRASHDVVERADVASG
ncbi:MAG: helix-turn-helix domain-containing protein [Nocardioidaceae bacterium]|nr:helix-turn-helix domain-containing protein [Nocardioidaceae bacterium]